MSDREHGQASGARESIPDAISASGTYQRPRSPVPVTAASIDFHSALFSGPVTAAAMAGTPVPPPPGYALRDATTPEDLGSFARLAMRYNQWLGEDLGFQSLDDELASLPGRYAPPGGCILLASREAEDVGCIAVRPFDSQHQQQRHGPPCAAPACELKRLWVHPDHQRSGLGRALAAAALEHARRAGYRAALLDTLERLGAANVLYERLGFRRRAPYYSNPLPGAVYWELGIGPSAQAGATDQS